MNRAWEWIHLPYKVSATHKQMVPKYSIVAGADETSDVLYMIISYDYLFSS